MEPNYLLRMIFGGDPLNDVDEDVAGLVFDKTFNTGTADVADPVQKICARAQFDTLAKREGVSDERWDTPLTNTTAETDPATLPERSKRRLQKVYDAIDRTFAGHAELGEEAKAIARRTLADTRAGVIFDAA
jgi:hypothetical protein